MVLQLLVLLQPVRLPARPIQIARRGLVERALFLTRNAKSANHAHAVPSGLRAAPTRVKIVVVVVVGRVLATT